MNIINDLKKHVLLEQHCQRCRLLNEKHGYISNVEAYIDVFIQYIRDNIGYETKEYVVRITDNIWKHLDGCFFEDVDIVVNVHVNGNLDDEVSKGGMDLMNTELTENGLLSRLKGKFTFASTYGGLENKFSAMFAHEITHAYEDWWRLAHGVETLHNISTKTNYYGNKQKINSKDEITKRLSNIIYYLAKYEVSAYANMVYGELLKTKYDTLEDGVKIVEDMPIYKNYKIVGLWVDQLSQITHPVLQMHAAIEYATSTNMKKIPDFNMMVKKLKNQWRKQYKKFINTVSKMIYDMYDEQHRYLDDGIDLNRELK